MMHTNVSRCRYDLFLLVLAASVTAFPMHAGCVKHRQELRNGRLQAASTAAQKPSPQRSDRLTATEVVAPEPVAAQPASRPDDSSAAERLRELCREQVEFAGFWRYEKRADTQAIVPHADPPWPEHWIDILLEAGRPLCKSRHTGLDRVFVPEPEGRRPGDLSPGMVSLQYTTYALTYDPIPLLVKPSAVRFARLFASETGCSLATVEEVTERINQTSELELSIDGVKLSERIPDGDIPVADWLYRAALLHAFSPCGSGEVCREVTQGERTVLCFSDANTLHTWQACFCFFADGYPEYIVIVQLPRAALGKERDEETKKILGSLYRSILHFGLRAPE